MKLLSPFYSRMFSFLIGLAALLAFNISAQAQSFDEGLTLYQDGEYAKSAILFDQIHTEQGLLFAGKSYFEMKDFATAKSRLLKIKSDDSRQISTEADYTLSLIHFKQKDFGDALTRLSALVNQEISPQIATESERLYNDILNYLTFDQRNEILNTTESDTLKFDLVSSAMGKIDAEEARNLFTQLRNSTDLPSDQLEEISSLLDDDQKYADLQQATSLEAPAGLTYNIGVALPAYGADTDEYPVAQGLFLGYTLAAEQFNETHDAKVSLTYQNTGIEADSAQQALEALSTTGVDAVVGPLFSERARTMANVSEDHNIPILAPLANSESIGQEEGHFFQINPTFSIHGKSMAHYAVESLNFDKIAVIAERGSLGEISAKAFRDEMEELDADVPYFFVEDLGSRGYGLSKYTRLISESHSSDADSSITAVYAPFTGETSHTLIDQLLGQLNSLESNITVLGSQEWANANFSADKIGERPVYFTESFYSPSNSGEINRFKSEFKARFDREPNRFAMIGYDTATFLLQTLDRVVNPDLLKEGLLEQQLYRGLGTNIHFDGSNVNQRLMLFRITGGGTHLISK